MKFHRLLFLCLFALVACKPQPPLQPQEPSQIKGEEQTLSVSAEDPLSFQRGIDEACRKGIKRVKIPAGTYRVAIPGEHLLMLNGMKDFEIDASGVTFLITTREKRALRFQSCERVTFRGAAFVREIPPFSQGRVEAISEDGRDMDIRICSGYPEDIDSPKFFEKIPVLNIFAPGSKQPKPYIYDVYVEKVARLEKGLFRFHLRHSASLFTKPIAVGDYAAWRGTVANDVVVSESRGVLIENVTVRNGRGFAFCDFAGYGENTYRNCAVTYGPMPPGATVAPLLSSNADGFHSNGTKKGPHFENCLAEACDDDGFAIHGGGYGIVLEAQGKKIVLRSWEYWRKNPFCQTADRLRFYETQHYTTVALGKVKAFKALESYPIPANLAPLMEGRKGDRPVQYWEIEMEDAAGRIYPGTFVADEDRMGNGFVIKGCVSRNHRARGMFIQAGGLIENCRVENVINAGIGSWPEFDGFNQSDYARNVTLRGNMIRRVGLSNQPHCGAITFAGQGFYPQGREHEAILIANNTFEDNCGPNLVISSAQNVRVEHNRFVRPMWGEPPYSDNIPEFKMNADLDPAALVWVKSVDDISFKGNEIEAPGKFFGRSLETKDATRLSGTADGFYRSK